MLFFFFLSSPYFRFTMINWKFLLLLFLQYYYSSISPYCEPSFPLQYFQFLFFCRRAVCAA